MFGEREIAVRFREDGVEKVEGHARLRITRSVGEVGGRELAVQFASGRIVGRSDREPREAREQENAAKNKGGRPPKPMPEPIPDTPENVARAIMQGPPKERWRFEEGEDAEPELG